MQELGGVLHPDGLLVLTVHGAFSQDFWAHHLDKGDPEAERKIRTLYETVDREGIFFPSDGS